MYDFDIIEESKRDDRGYESITLIGYTHMIKYYVCKNKQDSDWIKSINNMVDKLSSISKTDKAKLVVNLDKIYDKARRAAYKEFKDKNYLYFTDISPIEVPSDFMFDKISNKEVMNKWLIENAYSDMVIRRLKIDKVLSEDEIEFVNHPKYSLKKAFPGIKD